MKMHYIVGEKIIEKPGKFIDGKWVISKESLHIDHLIDHVFKKIAFTDGGAYTLYFDPVNQKYWELSHLHGYLQGGGLRLLTCISKEEVEKKYTLIKGIKKYLSSNETILEEPEFIFDGTHIADEEQGQRILYLINNVLKLLVSIGNDTLYLDPSDNRLWELTYKDSKSFNPKKLACISKQEAAKKYKLPS